MSQIYTSTKTNSPRSQYFLSISLCPSLKSQTSVCQPVIVAKFEAKNIVYPVNSWLLFRIHVIFILSFLYPQFHKQIFHHAKIFSSCLYVTCLFRVIVNMLVCIANPRQRLSPKLCLEGFIFILDI